MYNKGGFKYFFKKIKKMRFLIKTIGWLVIVMSLPNLLLCFTVGKFTENLGLLVSGSFGLFLGLAILIEVLKEYKKNFLLYKTFIRLSVIYGIINMHIFLFIVFTILLKIPINLENYSEIINIIIAIIMTIFMIIIGFIKPNNSKLVRAYYL